MIKKATSSTYLLKLNHSLLLSSTCVCVCVCVTNVSICAAVSWMPAGGPETVGGVCGEDKRPLLSAQEEGTCMCMCMNRCQAAHVHVHVHV